MTLVPGANIGPYRVVEQIGRGGMATVYKAYQASLARYVAIKVLPAFFAEQPGFAERFQQEAIAVAKLRHPNILQIFDYGQQDGVTYIAGEFIDGGTLSEQIGKPLPVDYTVKMLRPIASALDYAHSREVLHRDVKPSNILQARDGTPILSDFGLAKIIGSGAGLTASGATVGTPEYMAPEQGQGLELTPAADQYALGVVAYEMLTGRVPFSADTPLAVLIAHMQKPLPLPRTVNPNLSKGVEAVLLKALAKEPGDRFANATQFIDALADPASLTAVAPVRTKAAAAAGGMRPVTLSGRPIAVAGVVSGLIVLSLIGFALTRSTIGSTASTAPTAAAAPAATNPLAVTAPPTPTAVATGATSATQTKGALLFSAKMDGTASEIGPKNVGPDASYGAIRTPAGAIELVLLKPQGQVSAVFTYRPKTDYAAEWDVQMTGSGTIGTISLRNGPEGGYEIVLNGTASTVGLRQLTCTGQQCNVQVIGTAVSAPFATRAVTIGATVQGNTVSLWVDGKPATTLTNATLQGQPVAQVNFLGSTEGTLRITGIRYYEPG